MVLNPDFVSRAGSGFSLDGKPYRLFGANCYYLGFASDAMAEDVFALAVSMGFNVLRCWAFLDRDVFSNSEACFQFQDDSSGEICVHKGATGLERLDRTVALAELHGIRLILPLVNYWDDFGGVNQYVRWFGLRHRSEFYTDERARRAYRNYAETLLLRTNTRTGRRYRDEPSILAWELANEPRCEGLQGADILFEWVDEMSRYLKAIDSKHLIGVGDEGFFRRSRAGKNPLYNGFYGVDCERLLSAPAIDFGTCHLYASYADQEHGGANPIEFGRRWIREHIEAGRRAGKPMVIEELGWNANDARSSRDGAFREWFDEVEKSGGAGALVWMIAGKSGSGMLYPDYDGYTVYDPSNKKTLWKA